MFQSLPCSHAPSTFFIPDFLKLQELAQPVMVLSLLTVEWPPSELVCLAMSSPLCLYESTISPLKGFPFLQVDFGPSMNTICTFPLTPSLSYNIISSDSCLLSKSSVFLEHIRLWCSFLSLQCQPQTWYMVGTQGVTIKWLN